MSGTEQWQQYSGMALSVTDCRSDVGITVGLLDGIIAICRVLADRDMEGTAADEALKDLRQDKDVLRVMGSLKPVTDRTCARCGDPDDTHYARLVDLCRRVVAAHDADDGGPTVAGSLLAQLQRELVSTGP